MFDEVPLFRQTRTLRKNLIALQTSCKDAES
jgi:hypothetical protein